MPTKAQLTETLESNAKEFQKLTTMYDSLLSNYREIRIELDQANQKLESGVHLSKKRFNNLEAAEAQAIQLFAKVKDLELENSEQLKDQQAVYDGTVQSYSELVERLSDQIENKDEVILNLSRKL